MSQDILAIDTTKWLCKYDYKFLEDSDSVYSLKIQEMLLQIGSHSSRFGSMNDLVSDSLHFIDRNNEDFATSAQKAFQMTKGMSRNLLCKYKVYKNYPGKGNEMLTGYTGKFLRVIESLNMRWEIESNKDTVILGYRCKKASTWFAGRKYVAWYSSEIPLNEGPYKFNGLPGLILRLYDTRKQHDFELVLLRRLKYIQPIYFSLDNYINVNGREYAKALQIHINELSGKVINGSIRLTTDENKAQSLQRLKSINNFIEKY